MMSYQGSLTRMTHAQKGGHSGGLDKPNFRFSLPISQLMAKAIDHFAHAMLNGIHRARYLEEEVAQEEQRAN